MSKRLGDVLTLVLTLCAVVVTALVVRREFFQAPPAEAAAVREVEEWEALAAGGTVIGPAGARFRIVEFSDFQCPFCASVQPELKALRDRYPGQVSVVFRHFPLEGIHPHAASAAAAAECAGEQGRFEALHDALFLAQDSIGKRPWAEFAQGAGVGDLPRFEACMREQRSMARVRGDLAMATRAGVDRTPMFLVDGKLVSGAEGIQWVKRWAEEELGSR